MSLHYNIFTPLDEAIEEIRNRRANQELAARVHEYLADDVPSHFAENAPVGYLCRHIATPNYETLRFIELAKSAGLPMVIGEDPSDLLVGNNRLKRALGKMPVTKGFTRAGEEFFEHCTVIDFSIAQGKPLREITTHTNEPLQAFHTRLLQEIYPSGITIADESSWIDRKRRGQLLDHYRQLLSLFMIHGIMFEWFEHDEKDFKDDVFLPAFHHVTQHFDRKPLIVELVPPTLATARDWNSYPSTLYQFIKQSISDL
jgi:hypothetical protein